MGKKEEITVKINASLGSAIKALSSGTPKKKRAKKKGKKKL